MCSLRDAAKELAARKVQVFALSLDDVTAQKAFAKAQELNFPLLSDPDGSATAKYGVLMEGRPYANRVTFVVDGKGVLRHIDRTVNVDAHGRDLVAAIEKLQAADK